jgi:hypothetical protein
MTILRTKIALATELACYMFGFAAVLVVMVATDELEKWKERGEALLDKLPDFGKL